MIVITVARKPVEEGTVSGNVLKHGTGALNIDASRIHSGSSEGGKISGGSALGQGSGWNAHNNRTTEIDRSMSIGRWPANVIFEHKPECKQTGTATVKGNRTDTRPEGDGGREDKSQWRFRPTEATKRGYSDPDGTETVDAWECADGCPVAELNIQSQQMGMHAAGSMKGPDNWDTGSYTQTSYHIAGVGKNARFGDTGGASRFFFVCQNKP